MANVNYEAIRGFKDADGWKTAVMPNGSRYLVARRRNNSYMEAVRDGLAWEAIEFQADPPPVEDAVSSSPSPQFHLDDEIKISISSVCVMDKNRRKTKTATKIFKEKRKAKKQILKAKSKRISVIVQEDLRPLLYKPQSNDEWYKSYGFEQNGLDNFNFSDRRVLIDFMSYDNNDNKYYGYCSNFRYFDFGYYDHEGRYYSY